MEVDVTLTQPMTPVAQGYTDAEDPGLPWTVGLDELDRSVTFWAATIHPGGRPHVVPVLAIVVDGMIHFVAGPGTRKARNLARDPGISITTHGGSLDLVLEGVARRVTDGPVLASVADAYASKYGWQVTIRDGAFHAAGAPTAGPPPYHAYRVTPHRAFGFPAEENAPATRWTFPRTP
jgi:hypothetical protein